MTELKLKLPASVLENELIRARTIRYSCQWITLEEKSVYIPHKAAVKNFYSLDLKDYVAIIAQDSKGRFPLVKQYRPAIEAYTWEFPSGMVEEEESPLDCCKRELEEEAGLKPLEVHALGSFFPDVGRLNNKVHLFYVRAKEVVEGFSVEPGLELKFVDKNELEGMFKKNEMNFIIHVALWNIVKTSDLIL